ncbi:unnamed protein product [Psylliodes chrysocephalus]|uniref:Pericentriolar material 1 protein C-terminal domain-containing protein n=1 Tax=Psylliodes chrysocephalus TaxID=3402493 RepID=A0A9P0CLJ6_9CUCU|nr:unnamed protein product [Psylliodes chrysocephala]
MSEEDQHNMNKRSTGTVPKQRIRYTRSVTEVDRLRSLSNSSSDYHYHDSYNELRSPRRSNQIVDTTFQAQGVSPVHVSSIKLNPVGSSNPSTTTSRKNSLSSTLKCDNITKHPNKKQIEDKLNQIHDEYLKVTNSLMESIKKVDNQGIGQNDDFGIDTDFSCKKNDGNSNLENIGLNLMALKDLDPTSLLQRKSENKCLSPRHNRSNLLMEVCNHKNSTSNRSNRSDLHLHHEGGRYNENEEKNRKSQINPQLIPTQDKTIHNMEMLNGPNINDSAEQIFDMLDLNDTELDIQHDEFHKRITDLQNKKFQIDQFLAQLQNSGANGEDVEHQVMKICAMKAQLKKLRNMLEFVKMPLSAQNSNNPPDYQKASCYLCSDNIGQKTNSRQRNDSNIFRSSSNNGVDSRSKQLNKMSSEKSKIQPMKPNVSSINQKTTLQSELESKKRELVELMGKHKVNPSNLYQDLGVDIKSDISFLMNGIHEPWVSVISNDSDSDKFSSDEYQNEINDEVKHNFFSLPSPSTVTNYHPTENSQRSNFEFRPVNRRSCSPETNRSNSAGMANHKNKPQMSNSQDIHSSQMQKQLEIIRSICDSMLEHQNNEETYSNTQNFQNNDLNSSHNHHQQQQNQQQQQQRNSRRNSGNSANNAESQRQWLPPNPNSNPNSNTCNNSNNSRQDGSNGGYYNLMTTNNIQTQSFMLNTLNQCYQMLWVQQKELTLLKSSISTLQEKLKIDNFETINPTFASLHVNSQPSPNPNPHLQHQQHQDKDSAYTMPISNQFDCPMYFNSVDNGNNGQLFDSCLDNINLNRINADQNSEHPLHANMNHLMPNHIWSGQALNNQVVPGNRANNYWDNFRSYSRQNLLSTKNNEVLQNIPTVVDRPNFINPCANPFAFMSFSKSNSEQDASNTSQDNGFQRIPFKETNPGTNLGTQSSGSVININDTIRKNEEAESPSKDVFHKDTNSHYGLPLTLGLRTNHEDGANGAPVTEEFLQEKCDQIMTDQANKSAAAEESRCINSSFEDLKENIYKEVASLISANENRPQFLIQLFRDLQLVKSDNVRENVLHSIERNIYDSRVTAINASTQSNPATYLQITSPLDLTVSCSSLNNNEYIIRKTFLQDVQLFLDVQEECIIQHNFYITLKDLLINLQSFKEMYKVKSYRIRLTNIIDSELQCFCGKKLGDVKSQLLQKIYDLVFVQNPLVHSGNGTNCNNNDVDANTVTSDDNVNAAVANDHPTETRRTPLNGDLAEADQSGTASEDFAEEGAVGGILEAVESKQIDMAQTTDSILVCSPDQTRPDSSTIDLCQSNEDSELLSIQNNSLFLDHQ